VRRRLFIILASGLAMAFAMLTIPAEQSDAASSTNFVKEVTNKFFPLPPGTAFFYEREKDGIPASDVVFVTRQTKQILGVGCTVVHDQAYENGRLVEDTLDF